MSLILGRGPTSTPALSPSVASGSTTSTMGRGVSTTPNPITTPPVGKNPSGKDPEVITLTARQLDSLLNKVVEDALIGVNDEDPDREMKPPCWVDRAPDSQGEGGDLDELPYNIKPLNYEYDGTINPYKHLMRFENSVILHRYGEGVKCRVFLTTLSKAA
ncbi:hypothetical protein ACS0TY_010664 [Phlomoides rotata]